MAHEITIYEGIQRIIIITIIIITIIIISIIMRARAGLENSKVNLSKEPSHLDSLNQVQPSMFFIATNAADNDLYYTLALVFASVDPIQ